MNEQGFSLLESVLAMLIVSIVVTCVVPVWSAIHRQQMLSSKMGTASRLATAQIERLIAGQDLPGIYTEDDSAYLLSAQIIPELAGKRVDVHVSFSDRGKTYEVAYQAIVPPSHSQ